MKPDASRTLADLRPNATVHCMVCEQHRPAVGAEKFHAHHVCRECAAKVRAKKQGSAD